MKKTRFEQMQEEMLRRFGPEQGIRIVQYMKKEYQNLSDAYADRPKALEPHTQKNIFPVVTAFRALLAEGMERTQAAQQAREAFLGLMDAPADAIRKILKFPGLYRLMPWLWKNLICKMFSEDAGFRYRFHPTDGRRVKFDMLECPYFHICQELDCQELASTFCTTDDICYGHMHPKLIWNRTKTLARDGDPCDFDLYIPE